MDIMLWLMAPVVLYAIVIRFILPDIEWMETCIKALIGCAIIGAGFAFSFMGKTSDYEVLNGRVSGKERNKVSCSHSYSCPPCTKTCSGTGSNQTCTEHCSTCYDHPYDVDWDVYTTVGGLEISRIDRQGLDEPPRWTAVKIGEPAARGNNYTNYVIGSPGSLFNLKTLEADKKRWQFPAPHQVYDYYRVQHAYDVGAGVKNMEEWNTKLAHALRDLGPLKQVDLNVIFVKGKDISYAESLERVWMGGKKNSVNVVLNVDGTTIDWVQVFTFGKSSGNEMLQVVLRDRLQDVKDTREVDRAIKEMVQVVTLHYTRPKMEKYKYLRSSIRPSTAAIVWILILEVLFLAGFTWWAVVNDMRSYHRNRRKSLWEVFQETLPNKRRKK